MKTKLMIGILGIFCLSMAFVKLLDAHLKHEAPAESLVAQSVHKVVNFGSGFELRFQRSVKLIHYFDGTQEGVYLFNVENIEGPFAIEVRWKAAAGDLKIDRVYRIDGINSAHILYEAK